jgi:stage II sporulation protein D
MRPALILIACLTSAAAQTVEIGVFGLFHPRALDVRPVTGSVIVVNGSPLEGSASLVADGRTTIVTARGGGPADFVLSVPGRIARRFHGTLEIRPAGDALLALLRTDLETAVASVTAAESGPGASMEALKAQAVVARSFFAASKKRHAGFAFCDTTHCQFFRSPPAAQSRAGRAAAETRGMVLTYQGEAFPPLYSANCGGRTKLPADVGLRVEVYPYFGVNCSQAGPHRGHGVGLCQQGAAAMAAGGADFRAILNYYYPGTVVRQNP